MAENVVHALNHESLAQLFNITQPKNTATRAFTDDTLTVTAKILLSKRKTEDNREIVIRTHLQEYSAGFNKDNIETWVDFFGKAEQQINLNIIYMTGYTFDALNKDFAECIEGKKLSRGIIIDNTLTAYLKSVVINTEDGVTSIFVPASSFRKSTVISLYHKIASAIGKFKCFETFFAKKPLTEEEVELLASLNSEKLDCWKQCADRFYNSLDINRIIAEQMLTGFTKNRYDQQLRQYKTYIQDNHDRIDRSIRQISEARRDIEEYEMQIVVLQEKIARGENGDKQLIDIISANKNIKLVRKSGNEIVFNVLADLVLHNEEMLEAYLKNGYSGMYTSSGAIINNKPLTRKFYEEVFLNSRWKLKTIAQWRLTNDCVCSALRHATFDAVDSANRLPNPHIQYFNCTGGHKDALAEAAKSGNYELAFLTAVQSTMSINWGDSTVLGYFMNDLWMSDKPVFYEPEEKKYYTRQQIIDVILEEHPELAEFDDIIDEELTF